MDSDVFNCPQSLLLAASRPGFCHLCNRKYCPPIIPSDHVTQSSAISPDPFQDLYIFLAWNGVSQNICGSLPDYDLWWGFFVCVLLFWTPTWNDIAYLFASLLNPQPHMQWSMGPRWLSSICSLPWCAQLLGTEANTLSPFTAILAQQRFL